MEVVAPEEIPVSFEGKLMVDLFHERYLVIGRPMLIAAQTLVALTP
jgi:hypothetical protein